MTHLFEMSVTDRNDAIYTKADLLVNPDGTPNHPQPDSPLIDLSELLLGDGWMQATSPAGRAEYKGVVAWSPSARQQGHAENSEDERTLDDAGQADADG